MSVKEMKMVQKTRFLDISNDCFGVFLSYVKNQQVVNSLIRTCSFFKKMFYSKNVFFVDHITFVLRLSKLFDKGEFPFVKKIEIGYSNDVDIEKYIPILSNFFPNVESFSVESIWEYYKEEVGQRSVDIDRCETTVELRIIKLFKSMNSFKNLKTLKLGHDFDPPLNYEYILEGKVEELHIRAPTEGIVQLVFNLKSLRSLSINTNDIEPKMSLNFDYERLLAHATRRIQELRFYNGNRPEKRTPHYGDYGFILKSISKKNSKLKVGLCACKELRPVKDIIFRKKGRYSIFLCSKCSKCGKCSKEIGDEHLFALGRSGKCKLCPNGKKYCKKCMKSYDFSEMICPKCDKMKWECFKCKEVSSRLGMIECKYCEQRFCSDCNIECNGCKNSDCDKRRGFCEKCLTYCVGLSKTGDGCPYGNYLCKDCSDDVCEDCQDLY